MKSKSVCVLGAGLCGVSVTWQQEHFGKKVHLIEASNRLGGVLQSKKENGYLLDYGANTFNLRLQETNDLLKKMGVLNHAVDANPKANKRFIVRNGKIIPLPQSIFSFLTSNFLSPIGKLRLFLEPFIAKGNFNGNESVSEFIKRRLGKEALDYCANPFIGGIYASKPESLSLAHAFPSLYEMEKNSRSIFLGSIKAKSERKNIAKSRLISFTNGMEEIVSLISSEIKSKVSMGHKVVKIEKLEMGWKISSRFKNNHLIENIYDEVVCTLPAHKLQDIEWKGLKRSENIEIISNTPDYPLNLVYLGFDREQVKKDLDGFGFLVPSKENMNILGALFSSTLFPDRAPKGKVLLTAFVGGERMSGLTELNDLQTYDLVLRDLSKLLKIDGTPDFKHIKRWKRGIPLPDNQMGIRKHAAQQLERSNPGLTFSGSHLTGVSLPNCLKAEYSNS